MQKHGNRRLTISSSELVKELGKGDSIAVSGVCLTAVQITAKSFGADLAEETWNRTSFSRIKKGALVNLELPMRPTAASAATWCKVMWTARANSWHSTPSKALRLLAAH